MQGGQSTNALKIPENAVYISSVQSTDIATDGNSSVSNISAPFAQENVNILKVSTTNDSSEQISNQSLNGVSLNNNVLTELDNNKPLFELMAAMFDKYVQDEDNAVPSMDGWEICKSAVCKSDVDCEW